MFESLESRQLRSATPLTLRAPAPPPVTTTTPTAVEAKLVHEETHAKDTPPSTQLDWRKPWQWHF